MQLYFAPASYGGGGYGTAKLDTVPGMTLGASQLRPESTGHVKAVSADPTAKPEIQPNYLAVQTDRDALLAAMKYLRRLLATPPLCDHVIRENFPGPDVQTDEQLMAQPGPPARRPIIRWELASLALTRWRLSIRRA